VDSFQAEVPKLNQVQGRYNNTDIFHPFKQKTNGTRLQLNLYLSSPSVYSERRAKQ